MSDNIGRNIFDMPKKGEKGEAESGDEQKPNPRRNLIRWIPLAVIAVMLVAPMISRTLLSSGVTTVEYSDFKQQLAVGVIERVEIGSEYLVGSGTAVSGDEFLLRTVKIDDANLLELLDERGIDYYAVRDRSNGFFASILSWILPFAIIIFIWTRVMKRAGGMGSDILSIGKSRSRIVGEGETGTVFADVAGADEAKYELEEIVDFLKRPERYAEVGGRIPKGVLLVGAPGTGKTLLARAVAGEASVPFFRLSGADFVEMFVGVGASRVRDLFKQARAQSPSIIFIDELDAIGRSRSSVGIGGNDEREQTLNQLLVELDGFDSATGVIVIAATNRPEVLDPALLRPGRFDRQVLVDKPDIKGREEILAIHVKNVSLDPNVDLSRVARATAGLAGADLANIVNEAALLAVRSDRKLVIQEDFSEAIEKSLAGLSRTNRVLEEKERRIVAFHEVGHALMAYFTDGADPVEKISIVPRGLSALGYTLQLPTEERFLMTKSELLGRIDVLLAGRAIEEIVFGDISTGAGNDLTRAAEIARKMITDYGMSERFRNLYLPSRRAGGFLDEGGILQREYAESTQTYIDEESARIIDERYNHVTGELNSRSQLLQKVAETLLAEEVLDRERFEELIGTFEGE